MSANSCRSVRFLTVAALALLVFLGPSGATRSDAQPGASDDVIVIFREGTDLTQRDMVLRQAGAMLRRHFRSVNAAAARLPGPRVRAVLEQDRDVVAIVPDRPIHAHPKPPGKGGGGGGSTSQVVPAGVQRIGAAPGSLFWTGNGVGVAVMDTGLDFAHPDLQPFGAVCFTAYAACQDDNGHGTHVGGIIAARNNGIDVVGVAPEAMLYAVKVLDNSGSGTDSTLMAGLEWIVENAENVSPPIRVVNLSLGRAGTLNDNPPLRALVQTLRDTLGIAVVVSAGNDPNREVSDNVPATYPEVMAIASTTAVDGSNQCPFFSGFIAADTASYFTTDGSYVLTTGIGVTVSAPGEDKENINRGCFAQSVGILSTKLGGGTTRKSGTSMAAPHVAGVVALMWHQALSNFTVLDPEAARVAIREAAVRTGQTPLDSPTSGYTFDGELEGIVSAPGALQ